MKVVGFDVHHGGGKSYGAMADITKLGVVLLHNFSSRSEWNGNDK